MSLVHVLALLFIWLPLHWDLTDHRRDVPVYHQAAGAVHAGRSPYTDLPGYGPDRVPSQYFYPPAFAAALSPLGQLSFENFARVWYLALLGLFWVYSWCLAALYRYRTGRVSCFDVLVAGLLLEFCPGTLTAMSLGNAEPLLWASVGCALVVMPARPALMGALLAFAALIKIHPLWCLLTAVACCGKKAGAGAAAVLAAGLLLSIAVCGFDSWQLWWHAASPVAAQGTFLSSNYSLSFAGLRLAGLLGWHYPGGPLAAGPKLYLWLTGVIAPAAIVYGTRNLSTRLRLACIAAGAVLFSPLYWVMYCPMLLAPLAVYLNERRGRGIA